MDSNERRREASDMDVGDRISSLPDDLLHSILVRLRSTPAAARTSLLSRRWRHVWTQLREVVLDNLHASATVTAALARLAAADAPPALTRLEITFRRPQLTPARIAPWLDFASQRLTGELSLNLPLGKHQAEELQLPFMAKVETIRISSGHILRLPSGAGSFAALVTVSISDARLDGRDVACFGSSRCPRLRALYLRGAVRLVAASDVSIRSESLETLFYRVENTRRLEVVAPRLRVLRAQDRSGDDAAKIAEARIVAPNLADVAWYGAYDPARHQFVQVGRHLQLLLMVELSMTALMRRFDAVDELVLRLAIPEGIEWYERFLTATSKLAKCEAMEVYLATGRHAFAPSVLHVLRQSNGVRKLLVHLPMTMLQKNIGSKRDPCELGCPCCLPENYRTDNVAIDSLEEVIIIDFRGLYHHKEFLDLLLECSTSKLRNLSVYMSADASVSMESCQKIRNTARPDTNIQFNVLPRGSFLKW